MICNNDALGADTLTRGRSQLLGSSVPCSGSEMHGPAAVPVPANIDGALAGALPAMIGAVGKSVHSPLHFWMVTGGGLVPPSACSLAVFSG